MKPSTPDSAHRARKTILIADDHPVLCRGLTALIEAEPDLAVIGTVCTFREVLASIRASQPDLVTVDLRMGDGDGLELLREIRARHPHVLSLVLSAHDESLYAERALHAGARGYVSKACLDTVVLTAIRRVLAGEVYMSDAVTRRLAMSVVAGRTPDGGMPEHTLSDRELQVFRLIGEGRSTRQIAEILMRSVKTIESHREHIKNKLALASGPELVRSAAQWAASGLVG